MSAEPPIATTEAIAARSAMPARSRPAKGGRSASRWRRQRAGDCFGRMFWSLPMAAWIIFDVLVAGLGLYVGFNAVGWYHADLGSHVALHLAWAILGVALTFSGLIFGWYERDTLLHRSRIASRSILTALLALVITYFTVYVFMYADLSRRISFIFLLTLLGISVPARALAFVAIRQYKRGLLIVGSRESAKSLVDTLSHPFMKCYKILGFICPDAETDEDRWYGYNVWRHIEDIERICLENEVQEVIVDTKRQSDATVLDATLSCLRIGCRVTNQPTFFEKTFGQIPVEQVTPEWFLFADLQIDHIERLIVKRIFDVVTSLFGLTLTLPLWPILALIVWLDSRGPIFYSQLRVGQNGKLFRLYKFRTMKVQKQGKPSWTADNDPRITRLGRYLRKSHLDELPQLWNILCGQMSLVGPRPEQPDFVRELATEIPFYKERHLIKPGLTGWAQINYGYGNTIDDARRKLQLDLYYVKHTCIELDLTILFRTLGKLFHDDG